MPKTLDIAYNEIVLKVLKNVTLKKNKSINTDNKYWPANFLMRCGANDHHMLHTDFSNTSCLQPYAFTVKVKVLLNFWPGVFM